jgi:Rap1a immunity proteins
MLALRFASTAIFVLGLSMANAQQSKRVETTEDLYEACKNAESPIDLNPCVSYISGVGDTMINVGAAYERKPNVELRPFAICDKPSHAAMVQTFFNWAQANSQKWSDTVLVGVMSALNDKWPCG